MNALGFSEIWEKLYQQGWGGAWPREEVIRWAVRCCPDRAERPKRRVLDVGCGNGRHLWMLAVEGFRVTGFDASPSAVRMCRQLVAKEELAARAEVIDGGLEVLDYLSGPFEMALDSTTLCSVRSPERQQALKKIARLLATDGSYLSVAFGKSTTGFGTGRRVEEDGFDEIPAGALANRGFAVFHDPVTLKAELEGSGFQVRSLDTTVFTTHNGTVVVELLLAECGRRT